VITGSFNCCKYSSKLNIRYDVIILTCAQNLAGRQLNLPHGTRTGKISKRTRNKNYRYSS